MTGNVTVPERLREKVADLERILVEMGRVLVAFSGGTDSTLLLKVAADALGDGVHAVTAVSETTPVHEKREAAAFCRAMNIRHSVVASREMAIPSFADNPADKCYICKKSRFGELVRLAAEEGIPWVADGENSDDADDYRPGSRAARELGVRSPLREAGLTKGEVRLWSQRLGLSTWNKPSSACLASRIPYGQPITAEKLRQVDAGEDFLRELGLFRQVRIRHEGETARIEVEEEAIDRLVAGTVRRQVVERLRALGFRFVALDLEGYSTGSLNRVLETDQDGGPARPPKGVDHG